MSNIKERLVSQKNQTEDVSLDMTLRPQQLGEFIGQPKLKENLSILMSAAKQRREPVEHVLLYGAPGLGKTTLAHIIAKEMNAGIRVTSGPAIERAGDLAAILTNLEDGDVFFIDEIHRLNRVIEEVLYPALEDGALDIVIGKGPQARTLRLELPKFTLVGATTKLSLVSAPLRDRFGTITRLEYYQTAELEQIVLAADLTAEVAQEIAARSRSTPRVANRLLKRVRDYAQVKGDGQPTFDLCQQALALLEIDSLGLDNIDRQILQLIIEKFGGGPVGLSSLSAATGEETATIEEVYEPYLMQIGFLSRGPRGRMATPAAYKHLSLKVPASLQSKLV
jgi:holliday junction DNA helicase RuvB